MMKRNCTTYKGRFLDYALFECSCYPYRNWVWAWGVFAYKNGRKVLHVLGKSATRPNPSAVFPNLLT